ncbi:MAG: hypothetical protein ABSB71_00485 [Candidatus Bathyarchaeia archaeon]
MNKPFIAYSFLILSMGRIGKSLALILILILAISSLSLIMVKPSFAQTPTPSPIPIPTPSVPEFTVKFVNSSYEVPPSSSINPYTGQNVTNPSYYVDNESIVITITNQPFVSFIDNINGSPWNISLFYDVREKGHFAENWTNVYFTEDMPIESGLQYTVLTYPVTHYSNAPDSYTLGDIMVQIPAGGQVDFQVEALIGYSHRIIEMPWNPWVFEGQTSGWSNTQTITIPATSTSASPSPTPTIPEFPSVIVVIIVLIVLALAISVLKRKRQRAANTFGKITTYIRA